MRAFSLAVIRLLIASAGAILTTGVGRADVLPPSVLMLDQAAPGLPAYADIAAHFKTALAARSARPIAVYAESMDLSRFSGPAHQELLKSYLREKYRNVPIGVIVTVGARSLEFAISLRSELWTEVPIVFGAVAHAIIDPAKLPPDVTGQTVHVSLANALATARAIVPDLRQVALVGDPLERQSFRFHFMKELPLQQPAVIDLTGLPMRVLKERLSTLPNNTAIIYTTINIDGDGRAFMPSDALAEIASAANRPIVVDVERQVGLGATGGFVVKPAALGRDLGYLTARLFNDEPLSAIPVAGGDAVQPVFDWRQLQRWAIDESKLPSGSEIRFRPPSMWDQYRWQTITVGTLVLILSALVVGLIYEDHRRRIAEANNHRLLGELAHVNRLSTAGELTASIAHEVRQPLAAIVASGGAGLNWLKAKAPNLEEVQIALQNIVKEGHRADDVIKSVRAMFRKDQTLLIDVDVNESLSQVLALCARKIDAAGITLKTSFSGEPRPIVLADPVQLQQVFLNLIMNAVEAMVAHPRRGHALTVLSYIERERCIIAVEDTGPGISPEQDGKIFGAFFTTKPGGMGLGLTICKSIVDAHGGQLTMLERANGAAFQIALPLSRTHDA